MLLLPGMIDAHVHLRQPGGEHKETVFTGTGAALAGGVVAVLDMPNNQPPIVTLERLLAKRQTFAENALVDHGLFAGFDGHNIDEVLAMAPLSCGLKLYLDETFGDMRVDGGALPLIFEAWPGPGSIAVHGEHDSIVLALSLAKRYGQKLHVCHVPHPDDLLLIDRARQQGTRVTCEVTPHHLFLNSDDAQRLGALGQMKPPLVSSEAVSLFWDRLNLVDIIASDHAPHTLAEKASRVPPPGVPGLETTLPLLLMAVDEGRLTLQRLLDLVWYGPLSVYGLAAPADTSCEFDLGSPYRLPAHGYVSRCGWSPFAGKMAMGRLNQVKVRGRIVWQDGVRLVAAGAGRELMRAEA